MEVLKSASGTRCHALLLALWVLSTAVACVGASEVGDGDNNNDDPGGNGGTQPAGGSGEAGSSGDTAGSTGHAAGSTGGLAGGRGGSAMTSDAGSSVDAKSLEEPVGQPDIPSGWKRAAVAVGYGGVRLSSFDDGVTWEKTGEDGPRGGDDGNLLRSVAFGNGMWVAGGWNKWHTSTNAKTWTTRAHSFGIMQGMAFGNGSFLASEMNGDIYKSQDGLAWNKIGHAGTGKHTELTFGNGKFAAWGQDNSIVETSSDGATWQRASLKTAAYCGGADFQAQETCFGPGQPGAWDVGLWLKAAGGGSILRSVDGKKFAVAFRYADNAVDAVAIGLVPK